MPRIDYLIVGQGLAGSFLGYSLIKRNQEVLIFDPDDAISSSKVAAGIFNPVTGQRMALSWNAHRVFEFLEDYYPELEEKLESKFYFPIGVYKPFAGTKDQNDWMGRSADRNFAPFIKKVHHESRYGDLINDAYGGVELNSSGYVNTNTLLAGFKRFFEKNNAFVRERFDRNALSISDHRVHYKGITANRVIFCEGPGAVHDPYFNHLPFGLVKGEILTLRMNRLPENIISRDIFVLPVGGLSAKAGSTYDRNDLGLKTTPEARNYLEKKLNSLLKTEFEVVDQVAGIRPATRDRKPFIGLHPETKLIGLFNGLGTKGVSLGPYYSNQFADFLVFNKKFDEEVNLRRYI